MAIETDDEKKPVNAEKSRTVTGIVRRHVPILEWLPRYERAWLTRDSIAGATIWGLLIPEMIAYAGLAGLPPQAGLYTLLASLALYAIFGTSRHLVVAGTSTSAVLVFSTITELKPADPETYMALAAGHDRAHGAPVHRRRAVQARLHQRRSCRSR